MPEVILYSSTKNKYQTKLQTKSIKYKRKVNKFLDNLNKSIDDDSIMLKELILFSRKIFNKTNYIEYFSKQ